ncbi:O-antigen ligase family protein [Chitinilyticum piscinae]|uniref:O-antigen ligase family protein n=1 Tax=Chitinilyticum piscinae TaxID=2866724 RepID=A0A8J7FKY2_9NEIS|nr:O-antigen ligase family protein [Chitinilyticum piscinae]MBE9608071.1 O-antigen ligase family protein [Chitinilyticum piscinae]
MNESFKNTDRKILLLGCAMAFLLALLPLSHTQGIRFGLLLLGLCCISWRQMGSMRWAWPLVIWLGFACTTLIWSASPDLSKRALWLDGLLPIIAFVLVYQASQSKPAWLELGFIAGMLLLSAIIVYGKTRGVPLTVNDKFDAGPGYWYPGAGTASTVLVYLLPLGFYLSDQPRKKSKFIGISFIAIATVAATFTGNRFFWIAALASLFCYILLASSYSFKRMLCILLVVCAVGSIGVRLANTQRGAVNLERGLSYTAVRDARPQIWAFWLDRVKNRPWLGKGLGTLTPVTGEIITPENRLFIKLAHAHNYWLNVVLQSGLAGLILVITAYISVMREFLRHFSSARREVAAGLAVLVAMLAKNFTDDFMHGATVMLFWSCLGYWLAQAKHKSLNDQQTPVTPASAQ